MRRRRLVLASFIALTLLKLAPALGAGQQPLPTGVVVPAVQTLANSSQGYALYLPAGYTRERTWPLILVFDPGARGPAAVTRFQLAAQRYGYIVVGSNNSRNGIPGQVSDQIISTLATDVLGRFSVDQARVYTAGMSGGARVALGIALQSKGIAGVIAASAGYPDAEPRKSVPFSIFATAGTEDFNLLEMRLVERELTTRHRLVVFQGGHVWASNQLLFDAVEWMELGAIAAGIAPKNDEWVRGYFERRVAAASATLAGGLDALRAERALVDDFKGLVDVSAHAAKAETLARDNGVRLAERREREEVTRERALLTDVYRAETRLADPDTRMAALAELRRFWQEWSTKARAVEDSPETRLARRLVSHVSASSNSTDREYREIIATYRGGGRGRGN